MRIDLRRVRKRFGRTEVLRGIDLTIPSGTHLVLVGPNGSGKSTLTRVILGLLSCEGEVLLDGRPPFADRVSVARRLAYVPQAPPALAAPVADLVRLVAATRGIEEGRIAAWAARFELDLPPIAGRPFRNLSGGMKQKLLLALALAADPSLLVLDEPTSSLDALTRERFLSIGADLPPETTLLVSSHRLDEIQPLADHVIALEEGQVRFDGGVAAYVSDRTTLPGGAHARA